MRFVTADIARDDLVAASSRGADAVVHLAWLIQPSRDDEPAARGERRRQPPRVRGRRRGGRQRARARVLGRHRTRPGRRTAPSTSRGPRRASRASSTRATRPRRERLLDVLEREHPRLRVVRLRPGLIFKREAATEHPAAVRRPVPPQPRCCAGAHPGRARHAAAAGPGRALARRRRGVPPRGDARRARGVQRRRRARHRPRGPRASCCGARRVRVQRRLLRAAAGVSWQLRLQPSPAGLDRPRARRADHGPHAGADRARLDAALQRHGGADRAAGRPARAARLPHAAARLPAPAGPRA